MITLRSGERATRVGGTGERECYVLDDTAPGRAHPVLWLITMTGPGVDLAALDLRATRPSSWPFDISVVVTRTYARDEGGRYSAGWHVAHSGREGDEARYANRREALREARRLVQAPGSGRDA